MYFKFYSHACMLAVVSGSR